MSWKSKLILGVLTALAMMLLTYALPRGGPMRDAALCSFRSPSEYGRSSFCFL